MILFKKFEYPCFSVHVCVHTEREGENADHWLTAQAADDVPE